MKWNQIAFGQGERIGFRRGIGSTQNAVIVDGRMRKIRAGRGHVAGHAIILFPFIDPLFKGYATPFLLMAGQAAASEIVHFLFGCRNGMRIVAGRAAHFFLAGTLQKTLAGIHLLDGSHKFSASRREGATNSVMNASNGMPGRNSERSRPGWATRCCPWRWHC